MVHLLVRSYAKIARLSAMPIGIAYGNEVEGALVIRQPRHLPNPVISESSDGNDAEAHVRGGQEHVLTGMTCLEVHVTLAPLAVRRGGPLVDRGDDHDERLVGDCDLIEGRRAGSARWS